MTEARAGAGEALSIRRAGPHDRDAVLALLSSSLNYVPDDEHAAFYRWKHDENPFGPSPEWVSVTGDGRIAGYRTFMRWEFDVDRDRVRAMRAVDTATDPAFRGRGIFTDLTMHALDEFRADGVGFVFNTPNKNSRPGYLKMGWVELGRPDVRVRLRMSPTSAARVLRRGPSAEKWSLPTQAGEPAGTMFTDGALAPLIEAQPRGGVRTPKSAAFLQWRYGFEPLRYQVLLADDRRPADGLIVFRLRRRGRALEATVTDVLLPEPRPSVVRGLVRRVLTATGADYLVALAGPAMRGARLLPAPRQGPVLTWRAVSHERPRPIADWHLVVGDVELF